MAYILTIAILFIELEAHLHADNKWGTNKSLFEGWTGNRNRKCISIQKVEGFENLRQEINRISVYLEGQAEAPGQNL